MRRRVGAGSVSLGRGASVCVHMCWEAGEGALTVVGSSEVFQQGIFALIPIPHPYPPHTHPFPPSSNNHRAVTPPTSPPPPPLWLTPKALECSTMSCLVSGQPESQAAFALSSSRISCENLNEPMDRLPICLLKN